MSKVQRFWCDEVRNIRCVREDDFDALEAEAQSLREEVAALREMVAVLPEPLNEEDARRECGEYGVAMQRGYNACLRKLSKLEKQEPLLHINPLVVDELLGRAKRSPGGLTWSKERCGSWTLPLYAAPVAQAQYIVPDDVEAFLDEVRTELLRARSKFPGDRIMTIALAEEFGELCKAVLDEPAANVRKEAVQTAVMAARIVLDGDGSVTSWRSERGLDPLAGATGKED